MRFRLRHRRLGLRRRAPDRAPRPRRLVRRRARPLRPRRRRRPHPRRRARARRPLRRPGARAAGCRAPTSASTWPPRSRTSGRWPAYVEVNVEGTRNVLRACRTAGVERAVHVSTEAVLMHGQPLIHADESYPLAFRSRAPYSRSKALARAGRARGEPRRPRGDDRAPALRLGPRRHDAAAAARRGHPLGPLPLGRRRAPPDLDHAHRQHRRGAAPGGRARPRRSRLLRHRRPAGRVPRLRRRPHLHPGRHAAAGHACPPGSPAPSPRAARRHGSCCRCPARHR